MRIRRCVGQCVFAVCGPLALLIGVHRGGLAEEGNPAPATRRAVDAAAAEQAEKHPGLRWAVEFSPDGKTVAVSSGSRSVRNSGELTLFDVATGAQIATFERDLGVR